MSAAHLSVTLPDELVDEVARKAAALVLEQLAPSASPFLTVAEAAEFLRSSRQRVYDLLSDGRLTRHKDGARVLVERAELLAYVAGGVAHPLPRTAQTRMTRQA